MQKRKAKASDIPAQPCTAELLEEREEIVHGQKVIVRRFGVPRWKTDADLVEEVRAGSAWRKRRSPVG